MGAALDELRGKIINAFSSVPRPEKEEITECQCWECSELKETFSPLLWNEVPPRIIDENEGQLSLFTPKAYRYFLPSYLVRCLDNFDPDNFVCELVIYSLSPDISDEVSNSWAARRFKTFDSEQKKAIASFLELVLSTESFRE